MPVLADQGRRVSNHIGQVYVPALFLFDDGLRMRARPAGQDWEVVLTEALGAL